MNLPLRVNTRDTYMDGTGYVIANVSLMNVMLRKRTEVVIEDATGYVIANLSLLAFPRGQKERALADEIVAACNATQKEA